jgi:hypothetical protein
MSISNSAPRCRFFAAVFAVAIIVAGTLAAQDSSSTPANAVPQGTLVLIRLAGGLDTHKAKAGDRFEAWLAEPLVAENGRTIDAGKKITGHISAVEPGWQKQLLLSFDDIETSRGRVPLMATVTGVPSEHGLRAVGYEGEIAHKGMTKEQIAEAIALGAGEGAKDAFHAGDKRAAALGAGTGAATSAMTAFESGHDLVLEKGTTLEIRLDHNLMIAR